MSRIRPSLVLPALLATLTIMCGDDDGAHARPSQGTPTRRATVVRSATTPAFGVHILDRIPHDSAAFTQGLAFYAGRLYESTGLYGSSSLRRIDVHSGGAETIVALPRTLFGEGIAILGDRLYQLTWKSEIALVYDVATLTLRDTLRYRGQGWGLTAYGDSLIMSDGTSRLRVLDPATFRVVRTLDVTDSVAPVKSLNELEYIDGEIWANVWGSTWIARIDPTSGRVRAWVDVSAVRRADPRASDQNVANGIAHDAASGRIFVTGKRWSWVYVVEAR